MATAAEAARAAAVPRTVCINRPDAHLDRHGLNQDGSAMHHPFSAEKVAQGGF